MDVVKKTIVRGIGRAARKLGVTYVYLWKVLNGRVDSPSLILKIAKEMPALLDGEICKVDAKRIVADNKSKYCWNPVEHRFVKKERYDRRYANSEE